MTLRAPDDGTLDMLAATRCGESIVKTSVVVRADPREAPVTATLPKDNFDVVDRPDFTETDEADVQREAVGAVPASLGTLADRSPPKWPPLEKRPKTETAVAPVGRGPFVRRAEKVGAGLDAVKARVSEREG